MSLSARICWELLVIPIGCVTFRVAFPSTLAPNKLGNIAPAGNSAGINPIDAAPIPAASSNFLCRRAPLAIFLHARTSSDQTATYGGYSSADTGLCCWIQTFLAVCPTSQAMMIRGLVDLDPIALHLARRRAIGCRNLSRSDRMMCALRCLVVRS